MSGVIMGGQRRVVAVLAGVAALVVVAAVAFVALRGNGSTVEARPTVTPTSSPVVTPTKMPTPSATVAVPELPAAAASPDQQGAEAFFRYFVDVYNYSFRSLDSKPMSALSEEGCKFCKSVVSNVDLAKERELRYEGSVLALKFVAASPGKPKSGLLVVAALDQSEGRTIGPDGSVRDNLDSLSNLRVEAGVRWTGSSWRIFAVKWNTK